MRNLRQVSLTDGCCYFTGKTEIKVCFSLSQPPWVGDGRHNVSRFGGNVGFVGA